MTAATRGIVVCFAALALAALLNAQGLRKSAETRPAGIGRDVELALTRPLASISHALYLDRPRHELQVAIGRGNVDKIDTTIRLAAPLTPPAAPSRKNVSSVSVHKPKPRKPAKPAKRAFSPSHPLRIWVAGDSLAQVPGDALERAAGPKTSLDVLTVESRLSTGLGRPDLYNWFDRIVQAIRTLHPNVAVLSFGADDAHDYMSGVPAGHTIGPLGSPSWNAEYRRRAEGVTRELNAAGVYVVWLGAPITRGTGYRRGFRVVNSILHGIAHRDPTGAAYVDAWHLLATKTGRYADYLPDAHGHLVLMRASDGIHYTAAAGDAIARAVLRQLNKVYDLTSWRRR